MRWYEAGVRGEKDSRNQAIARRQATEIKLSASEHDR